MPLVMPVELEEAWLVGDADRDRVLARAREAALERELEVFPSDPVANSVHYEGPRAVQPIQPEQLSLLDRPPARRRPT
jgi:hypothetical protein